MLEVYLFHFLASLLFGYMYYFSTLLKPPSGRYFWLSNVVYISVAEAAHEKRQTTTNGIESR